ncbi:MAG: hypothetical protein EBS93_07880 [Chitinophagia bacterium]|nr:hypothetical protein [Chitinophagia bacterium]
MKKEIDEVLGRTTQSLYGSPGQNLDDPTKEALGLGNLEGYMIEAILARAGANPGKLDNRSVDYQMGLGKAASLFGIEPDVPTEVKRDVKGGLSKARANFRNYFAKFAFGGKTDGPGFEEIKQQIIDKYPEVEFRISKRKRAWGYNLMGALKSEGGLSGKNNGLNFQQPGNLKELQEYADKLASKLMNPEQLVMGGLISNFASGGTIPAMVSNGEAFIPPAQAKKIGYAKLNKMNQADRNGMSGFAVGGGIFKGPGSGTSDSIGPIDLPVGGYVIREKAVKALNSRFNKGGTIGKIQKFIRGGIAEQQTERAQGSLIQDVKQAEKTFAMLMGQLGKGIRSSIIENFQGIEAVGAGKKTSLGTTFTESTRGQAAFANKKGRDITVMGLQIMGKKAAATTETVAHETGHLADYSLGGKKGFASQTEGTFQFQLIEKIKSVMEKAFIKAGKNAQEIANYLTKNEELFAEFFAKASPEVRAIITSTTDAQVGMKALADHLGDIGYTYAGLEASDIDPTRAKPKKPASGSKILGALSAVQTKVKSFFSPTITPSSGPAAPAIPGPTGAVTGAQGSNQWPAGLQQFTTQGKLAKAAEQAEFFAYKAKEAGQSINQFGKSLATKVIDKTKDLQTNLANRKTGLRYDIIGKGSDLKGIKDDDILKAAKTNFIQQIKDIDPSMAADKIDKAAQAIVDGLQKGLSLEDIQKSSEDLRDVFKKTYTEAESLQEAFKIVAQEAGMSAEALKSGIGTDKLRREQFIQSDAGKSFGPLAKLIPDKLEKLSKTGFGKNLTGLADKLSGKGLEDRLGKTLGSFGTVIGDKINKLGGPMVALGASMSILGDKLPTLLGSKYATSETAAGVAGAIGGAGQGLASGAVLGAQLAGPVGAMIGGISGAIINGISGAFEAFNQKKLENNLKALEKTSGDLEIALKKLQITSDEKSANAVKEAAMKDIQTLATTGEQAQFGTGGTARGWLETLRMIPGVGAVTGANQEQEARQAVVAGIERQLDAFGRLGERNLARSSADQVRAVMKQAEEAAAAAPGGPESEAGKQARTDVLARSNQTYQMMSRQGLSEKDIFRGMAIVSRKQKGQDFAKDLQTPEGQAKLIEEGKKLAAVEAEGANKAKLLSDAMRDVNIQSDNLVEQFRKVQSYLERFGQEIEIIKNNANDTANALRGQASVRNTNRQSEQILGNISAYSTEEVNRVAEETAAIAGGGEGGKQIATQIKTAKVIQDELPRLLKGATGQNVGGVVDQLREIFKNATIDAPPELFNEIEKNLEEKVSGRQGTSLADLGSDLSGLEAVSKSAAEGLKIAQAFQKQYNDALQVVINLTNEYGKALNEATEWQLKAADISARSDLQLAETLGKNLSLSEKNRPQEQRIRGLTQGIMVGGTMDPAAIYRGMQESIRALGDAQAGTGLYGQREALRANMQRNPADAAAQKAYIDNENAIAKQTNTVNNARKALEELASDGTAAANALSLIQEQQKAASASVNFLQKALTSDASELDKMNKGLAAYTKLVSGKATTRDINSLQFRQQAFGGLQELQGLIPDSIFGQMQARMSEAMIDAMPGGKEMLDRGTGALVPDGNGGMREMTFREAIRNKAQGKDPQQEKLIQAYYAAADTQQKAASILATAAMDVATTFKEAQTEALAKINEEIPNMMTKAQNETAGIPTPETAQAPKDAIFVLDENQLNALRDAATIKWGSPPSLGLDANLDKSISSLITAITVLTTTSGLMGGLGRMMGFGGPTQGSFPGGTMGQQAAKTAASGADDAVEAAAKSVAKTATAGAAKTAVQGVDTTADVLKTADTALDMTKLAKVGTGLKMLGKILGPLDVIIGTYQGATSQSEQAQANQENFGGVIGTGYNTTMGALTGSAETGVSTTGSLVGLEEKTALNNILSLTEAGARGFATAGVPGAVVGTGAETGKMIIEGGREGIGAIQASSAAAQQAQANLALDANQRKQQRKVGGASGAPSIITSGLSALEAHQASLEASMRTKVATGEMSQSELDKILMSQRESRRQELDASEWTFVATGINDQRLDRSPEYIAAVEKLTATMLAAKETEKAKTEVAKSAQDVPEKAQTQQVIEQSQLSQVSSVDQTTSSLNTLRDAAIELADILRNIKIPVSTSVQTETPEQSCECKILAEILAELQKAKITGQTQPLAPTSQSAQTSQVDTPAEIRARQERASTNTISEQTALPQQPTSPGIEAKTSAETQTATKPESTPRTLEARKQAAKSQLADALKRKRYGKPLPGDDSVIEWGRSDLAAIKEEEKTENREQYLLSKDAKIREKYMTKTEKESGLAAKLAEKEKSGLVIKKEKVLTPYQQAQQQKKEAYLSNKKAKRQAYLSTLRPEIREKMLTKDERAERDAQNRLTPRTIPPGGMVAAATPGAERIEPSDPNVSKPQQESQVSATVGGVKPEVRVSQIQHTPPQLTPQQQEAMNSARVIGQQHKKDIDELRRRKAAGETLTQQELNTLSYEDSFQPAEETLSRRYGSPVSPQPVPSNLPKPVEYSRRVQSAENRGSLDGGASADKQAIAGMGTAITVDPSATQFLGELQKTFNSFDQYINKLQGVAATIPSKIELSGNYQLQVQITGAAALEGLQKSMKDMAVALIEPRLEQLRNEVSAATGGAVKPTSSVGRGSKSTSDVNM